MNIEQSNTLQLVLEHLKDSGTTNWILKEILGLQGYAQNKCQFCYWNNGFSISET